MNAILFARDEVASGGQVCLATDDRRARHLREVLRATVGQPVRVGVLDGLLGRGVVDRIDADHVRLTCSFDETAPLARDTLLLAIPRPKILLRCVETAAALGFGRILLLRTWRTDKSHVAASALASDRLRAHAILGLEQARRTQVPDIAIFSQFKPFVEDHLHQRCGDGSRLLADPDASRSVASLAPLADRPLALAIGPERGFTAYEREQLQARGFTAVHAGLQPLRVETALALVFGQLALLRRLAGFPPLHPPTPRQDPL